MKIYNKLSLCFIVSLFFGCSQNSKKSTAVKQDSVVQKIAAGSSAKKENTEQDQAERAKEWLLSSIKHRYKDNGEEDTSINMYTKQYLDYKGDAMSLEYDTVLTEAQFIKKWRGKYNTKFVTRGIILIGQQDWGKLKVTQCNFKNKAADNSLVYSVIIEDEPNSYDKPEDLKHKRDIKVIHSGNTFLIDDILEYD